MNGPHWSTSRRPGQRGRPGRSEWGRRETRDPLAAWAEFTPRGLPLPPPWSPATTTRRLHPEDFVLLGVLSLVLRETPIGGIASIVKDPRTRRLQLKKSWRAVENIRCENVIFLPLLCRSFRPVMFDRILATEAASQPGNFGGTAPEASRGVAEPIRQGLSVAQDGVLEAQRDKPSGESS